MNPSAPIYPDARLEVTEECSLKLDGQLALARPISMQVDQNESIYVLDHGDGRIKKFDRHGRELGLFGKQGQGPGEFMSPSDLFVHPEMIAVYSPADRRLTWLDHEGRGTDSFVSDSLLSGLRMTQNGDFYGFARVVSTAGDVSLQLRKMNRTLETVKVMASHKWKQPQYFQGQAVFALCSETHSVFYGDPDRFQTKYEISVFDADGELKRKIVKPHRRVKIPKEEIDHVKRNFRPFTTWDDLPTHYLPIYRIDLDGEGRILVCTSYKLRSDENVYDVFDPDGKYLACVKLKQRRHMAWANRKLYAIEEEDDDFWVKIYRVKYSFD